VPLGADSMCMVEFQAYYFIWCALLTTLILRAKVNESLVNSSLVVIQLDDLSKLHVLLDFKIIALKKWSLAKKNSKCLQCIGRKQ